MSYLSERLPNDLVRNPPWPETISTWPVNQEFLTLTNAAEEQLRAGGYELKFGTEINLAFMSVAEARKLVNQKRGYVLAKWRSSSRQQLLDGISEAEQADGFQTAARNVLNDLERLAEQYQTRPQAESREWLANWALTREFYQDAIALSGTDQQKGLAKKNFLIAALHLLPPHLGGLHGLIEQRFLSAHYGKGWWDGINSIELRTLVTKGHESVVANYHEVLWRMRQAAVKFGFVPLAGDAYAQLHFSVWRTRDNKNMMAQDDEESLAFRTKLGGVFFEYFDLLPLDRVSRELDRSVVMPLPFVGSSRQSTIRTCEDNWELRRGHVAGVTHLARDLYLITGAASETALIEMQDADPAYTPPDTASLDVLFDLLGGSRSRPVTRIKRVIIEPSPDRVACPFVSTLEGSVLGAEGEFQVPVSLLAWNRPLLLQAVGPGNADLFSVFHDDKVCNLETYIAWQALFRKIRVDDKGVINTSSLPVRLAAHFEGIKIASIRNDVHIAETRDVVTEDNRDFANEVKADLLAKGILGFHSREHKEEQMRLFSFIRSQFEVPDPEEAVPYLVSLYRRAAAQSTHGSLREGAVDVAVGVHTSDVFTRPLMFSLYYQTCQLELICSYFENENILKRMLAHRRQLVPGLPDAMKFDPPVTVSFFKNVGRHLGSSTSLYGFKTVHQSLNVVGSALAFSASLQAQSKLPEQSSPPPSLDEQYALLRECGAQIGQKAVLLSVAAQDNLEKQSRVLHQFTAGDGLLGPFPMDLPPHIDGELFRGFRHAFLSGAASRVAEQSAALLIDRTEVMDLRARTDRLLEKHFAPA